LKPGNSARFAAIAPAGTPIRRLFQRHRTKAVIRTPLRRKGLRFWLAPPISARKPIGENMSAAARAVTRPVEPLFLDRWSPRAGAHRPSIISRGGCSTPAATARSGVASSACFCPLTRVGCKMPQP
jgi:hypothetical protein